MRMKTMPLSRRAVVAGGSAAAIARMVGPALASLPGGHYLTPANASDPIATSDITSDKVYSAPLIGESNAVTVNDGTGFVLKHANQITLQLTTSAHLANNIYPVFVFYPSSGTPTLGTGPAWSSAAYGASVIGTAAACARDTTSGLMVNANAMTLTNGATVYSVAAGLARCVGGIRPYANGMVRKDVSAGLNRRCDVWNLNNRQRIALVVTESPSSGLWTIPSSLLSHPRNLNNDANCYADIFSLFPLRVDVDYFQEFFPGTVNVDLGLNWNSEVSSSGLQAWDSEVPAIGRSDAHAVRLRGRREGMFGVNKVAPVEMIESFDPNGAVDAIEMYGNPMNCRCVVEYEG